MKNFSNFRKALGEASGYPSDETLKRLERRERRQEIGLVIADLVLQPLVELKAAHNEAASERMQENDQLTIGSIRELSEQGVGVVVFPFRG